MGCLVFRNWEAVATVPTAEPYDFFAREKLFLADPSAASGGGGFRSYSNGKAAGNLALDGLTVQGVHASPSPPPLPLIVPTVSTVPKSPRPRKEEPPLPPLPPRCRRRRVTSS